MASYGDVRRWQADPLDDAERQLKARSDTLVGLADELAGAAGSRGWHGLAADAAAAKANRITDAMEHLVAGVNAARTALMAAADGVTGLRHLVLEAESLARARGFSIDDSGRVVDGGLPPGTPPDQAEAVQRERGRVMAELADRVTQVMTRAQDVDETLANLLGRVQRGEIGDEDATSLQAAAEAGAQQGIEHPPIPGPPPDPPSDAGAGEHGSDPWWTTFDDEIVKDMASDASDFAEIAGWTHAAEHLRHYLNNSGDPLTVDPDEIGRDDAIFQQKVDRTVAEQMHRLATEAAANGTFGTPIPFSTGWQDHTSGPDLSKDWYYAMGSFEYSVTGVATVHPPDQPGGEPRVEIDYRTHVHDYYNWDQGKQTEIGPFTIKDETMADLHRAGVAQEFTITGSSETRHFDGQLPPPGQPPDLPQPPDDRGGTRTDPGR